MLISQNFLDSLTKLVYGERTEIKGKYVVYLGPPEAGKTWLAAKKTLKSPDQILSEIKTLQGHCQVFLQQSSEIQKIKSLDIILSYAKSYKLIEEYFQDILQSDNIIDSVEMKLNDATTIKKIKKLEDILKKAEKDLVMSSGMEIWINKSTREIIIVIAGQHLLNENFLSYYNPILNKAKEFFVFFPPYCVYDGLIMRIQDAEGNINLEFIGIWVPEGITQNNMWINVVRRYTNNVNVVITMEDNYSYISSTQKPIEEYRQVIFDDFYKSIIFSSKDSKSEIEILEKALKITTNYDISKKDIEGVLKKLGVEVSYTNVRKTINELTRVAIKVLEAYRVLKMLEKVGLKVKKIEYTSAIED